MNLPKKSQVVFLSKAKKLTMMATALLVFVSVISFSVASVEAVSYPIKPVQLIVPFAPGGVNDILGRIVATKLSERLGRQVIVTNRAGGGSLVGTEVAAKSPPDGYTLLFTSTAHPITSSIQKVAEPMKPFVPISRLGIVPSVLVCNPTLPVKSLKELITYLKKQPGKLIYTTPGLGSFGHLAGELFKSMTDVEVKMMHFRGGGPALVDTVGGHSHISIIALATAIPHINSGKLLALGVGGLKRSPVLPEVPTISEAGVPGYEANNWFGILAPIGTPKAIVDKLDKELSALMASDEVKKRFEEQGAIVEYLNSSDFDKFFAEETAKWMRIIKDIDLKE